MAIGLAGAGAEVVGAHLHLDPEEVEAGEAGEVGEVGAHHPLEVAVAVGELEELLFYPEVVVVVAGASVVGRRHSLEVEVEVEVAPVALLKYGQVEEGRAVKAEERDLEGAGALERI